MRIARDYETIPETLTTTILLGSLLVPLGLMDSAHRRYGISEQWYPALGRLPIARKDVERLTQLIAIQPRLQDIDAPVRTQHARDAPQHLPRSAHLAGDLWR